MTALYRWDETGIGDFSGTSLLTPGAGTAALSYVSRGASETHARVSIDVSGFSGECAFPITAATITAARWDYYIRVFGADTGNSSSDYVTWGVCNNKSGANFYGVGYRAASGFASGHLVVWVAGVQSTVAVTGPVGPWSGLGGPGALLRCQTVVNSNAPGATPVIMMWMHGVGDNLGLDSATSSPASFGSEVLSTPFIGLDYANVRSGSVRFAEISLRPHYTDLSV